MGVRHLILLGFVVGISGCSPEPTPPNARVRKSTSQQGADADPDQSGDPSKPGGNGNSPAKPLPGDQTIPAGPTTGVIPVMNQTANLDLGVAKADLAGGSFSMTVQVNPGTATIPDSVSLLNFAIKAPPTTGFILYRPVLVQIGSDGKEKQFPIGENLKMNIPKGRAVPLAGLVALTFEGIKPGDQIKLRFSALEPLANALLDGIPNYRECKQPANFQPVANALQPCKSCHGGLFAYEFVDKDIATACGQNLKIIDKSLSSNGTTPAIPGGTHHGVNAGAVSSAVGPWRSGEGL